MKRYLVFAGNYYYPSGGWNDFHSAYDTLEEARELTKKMKSEAGLWEDWCHIIDIQTGEEVV